MNFPSNIPVSIFCSVESLLFLASLFGFVSGSQLPSLVISTTIGFQRCGLLRFYSETDMFAEARTVFSMIVCKRTAPLMRRMPDCSDSFVHLIWKYPACAAWKQWHSIHMKSRGLAYNLI